MKEKKQDRYLPYRTSYSVRRISVTNNIDCQKMKKENQQLKVKISQQQQQIKQLKTKVSSLKDKRKFFGSKNYKGSYGEVISCRLETLEQSYQTKKAEIVAENQKKMKKYAVDIRQMEQLQTFQEESKKQIKKLLNLLNHIISLRNKGNSQVDLKYKTIQLEERLEQKKAQLNQQKKKKKILEEQNSKLKIQLKRLSKKSSNTKIKARQVILSSSQISLLARQGWPQNQ